MRRTHRARVDDYRLAYETRGDGEPHLLFHWGLLGDRGEFLPVADRLEDWGTRLLVDGRGHGKSDAPREHYTLEEYADALARFLREVVVGPAVLIGQGWACGAFVRLALRHPHLAAGLVLANPGPEAPSLGRDVVAERILDTLSEEGLSEDTLDRLARSTLMGEKAVTEQPDAVAAWRRRMARLDAEELMTSVRAVLDRSDVSAELGEISVPALLLAGTEGPAPAWDFAKSLSEHLAGPTEVIELAGGHFAAWERPGETADVVRAFLESLGLRPGAG